MNLNSHLALVTVRVDIVVAADTEGMVKKARGHEGFLSSLKFGDDNEESLIVHFFKPPGMQIPDEPEIRALPSPGFSQERQEHV